MLISVAEIADQFNAQAASLARELLPNGHKAGNKWMASGIDDSGKSASLSLELSGRKIGHWTDFGNARAGEDKGDMIDLLALKRFGGDRKVALQDVKRRLGIVDAWRGAPLCKPDPQEIERRAAAQRAREEQRAAEELAERMQKMRGARALYLHRDSMPIAGTPASAYLTNRGLKCTQCWRRCSPGTAANRSMLRRTGHISSTHRRAGGPRLTAATRAWRLGHGAAGLFRSIKDHRASR